MDKIEEKKEKENYGSGHSSNYGYTVEWRLKSESAVLTALLGHLDAHKSWSRAPYSLSQLGNNSNSEDRLIRPRIGEYDTDKSRHDLINYKVAIALIACLQTSIPERMLKHIEWRIIRIRIEEEFSLTRDDENGDAETRIDDITNMLGDFKTGKGEFAK